MYFVSNDKNKAVQSINITKSKICIYIYVQYQCTIVFTLVYRIACGSLTSLIIYSDYFGKFWGRKTLVKSLCASRHDSHKTTWQPRATPASCMCENPLHHNDVIMGAMASQIICLTIVYSTVYSKGRSKKTAKLRVAGLCAGNSPVTGEFPA